MATRIIGQKLRPALVRMESVSNEAGGEIVHAIMPSWNPREVVRFSAELIRRDNPTIGPLLPKQRFFALINIGAENKEDLIFRGFEPAPNPISEDELA